MKKASKGRSHSSRGRQTASAAPLAFAHEGANVALADLLEARCPGNRPHDRRSGRTDACSPVRRLRADDVKSRGDKTIEAFGRLDYAFNNAGVEQLIKPAVEITDEEWGPDRRH